VHLRVLSSGSRGNATLIRAGETNLLVDAGLGVRELRTRLEAARVPARELHHILVTHGHLDHARSAGALAKRTQARLSVCERLMDAPSIRRAPVLARLPVDASCELAPRGAEGPILVRSVRIPHDAEPTVALRIEHAGRSAVILTDMGEPDRHVAERLRGAHVIVLEFNHDPELLWSGPYSEPLKRRIAGPRGHLSNAEAARMLGWMAGPELHTVVLAHLSEINNRTELALDHARGALQEIDRPDVRVVVASQHEIGESCRV